MSDPEATAQYYEEQEDDLKKFARDFRKVANWLDDFDPTLRKGLKAFPNQTKELQSFTDYVIEKIPPLLNDFIGLQKDSALVVVLGYQEGLRTAQILQSENFDFTPYVALALVYIIITIPQARFVDWLVERDRRRRQAAVGV